MPSPNYATLWDDSLQRSVLIPVAANAWIICQRAQLAVVLPAERLVERHLADLLVCRQHRHIIARRFFTAQTAGETYQANHSATNR